MSTKSRFLILLLVVFLLAVLAVSVVYAAGLSTNAIELIGKTCTSGCFFA